MSYKQLTVFHLQRGVFSHCSSCNRAGILRPGKRESKENSELTNWQEDKVTPVPREAGQPPVLGLTQSTAQLWVWAPTELPETFSPQLWKHRCCSSKKALEMHLRLTPWQVKPLGHVFLFCLNTVQKSQEEEKQVKSGMKEPGVTG